MTISLEGKAWRLSMNANATGVTLEDKQRRVRWKLDEQTRYVASNLERFGTSAVFGTAGAGKFKPMGAGKVTKVSATEIRCEFRTATLRWIMESDRLRVLAVTGKEANALALPGTFRPERGSFLSAVPSCQGILHTGKGPAFYKPLSSKGHQEGFTLAMFGQIAERGALVSVAETDDDAVLHWEKTEAGDVRLMWLQHASLGKLSYDREVVLFPADANLTAVCKTYRRYEMEKGRFRNWDAKLEERPALEKLFGAAIVFLGYFQDMECDYAKSLRRLKKLGIDKAVVYPMWCQTTFDVKKMLGIDMADTRVHAKVAKQLGYLPGSFIYILDGLLKPGRDVYMHDRKGKPMLFWQIKDTKWYKFSNDEAYRWTRKFLDKELGDLNMVHFDVLTSSRSYEDFTPTHRTDARDYRENRRRILDYAGSKGLVISSEGFYDRMTPHYDLGNSKYAQALGGDEYCVVPMTMLCYHDSAYHTWWEVDNYNNPQHRMQWNRGFTERYPFGGGWPRLQACMDALMGTPPDLYPFGRQYGYVPYNHPEVYYYRFTLDDPEVQTAINYAKPVLKLNSRIAKQEMMEHHLHHPNGAVQETVFADGTRVAANFANIPLEAPGFGVLPAESWATRRR